MVYLVIYKVVRLSWSFYSIMKTLHLPELIQFYWKDFGGSYMNVCALISKKGSSSIQADLKALMSATSHPKVTFTPYDWNACIVLKTKTK